MSQASAKGRGHEPPPEEELTYAARASQSYSFGSITSIVAVDGDIDRPNQLVDHMLSAITAVVSVEAVQQGLSNSGELGMPQVETAIQQMCDASVQFGNISLKVQMVFRLNDIPNRTLNSIVFGAILPKVWEAASIYLGNRQTLTSPPAPLPQTQRSRILEDIDDALALTPYEEADEAHTSVRTRRSAMTH